MDPLTVLDEPSTDLGRSTEDMLADMEALVDAVEMKLESAPDGSRARFQDAVMPKVEEARRLSERRAPLARNAIEDAIVLLRELAATAPVGRGL